MEIDFEGIKFKSYAFTSKDLNLDKHNTAQGELIDMSSLSWGQMSDAIVVC